MHGESSPNLHKSVTKKCCKEKREKKEVKCEVTNEVLRSTPKRETTLLVDAYSDSDSDSEANKCGFPWGERGYRMNDH